MEVLNAVIKDKQIIVEFRVVSCFISCFRICSSNNKSVTLFNIPLVIYQDDVRSYCSLKNAVLFTNETVPEKTHFLEC